MLTSLRTTLSYANLMATIAVFVALGGSAYAVTRIDANSVKSRHIVNDQVRGADVKESTLLGVKPYGNTIPSGTTVRGVWGGTLFAEDQGGDFLVSLPAPAPVALTYDNVEMEANANSGAGDADPTCTGSDNVPTAPPGKVCIYEGTNIGGSPVLEGEAIDGNGSLVDRLGFLVGVDSQNPADTVQAHGTWAYTAP